MISVVVLTKNEESVLKACLESVKWADEIVIVDQGSTDKTLEIAKQYTEKIFVEKNPSFAVRRNLGTDKATGDWVLHIDADERVLADFRDEILSLTKSTRYSAFAIRRLNVIFGEEVHYGPYSNDLMIRMVRKNAFEEWEGNVHEHLTFSGELGYFSNYTLHLTHRDLDHFVIKSLAWSKTDAQLRFDAGHPNMSGLRFIRILITETINQGIKRGGFFNGGVGVVDSMLQVFSMFMTYVRLWEMQRKPSEEVYDELDKKLIADNFQYTKSS